MKNTIWYVGIGCLVAAVVMAGCKTVIVRDEPQPVVYTTAPEPVIVQQGPPPVIVEQVPPSPGPGYVWIGGYQHWDRDHWIWVHGRYDRPPHAGAIWVQPRYENFDRGVRYHPGHWEEHH
jgi:hypothetical protein